MKVCIENSPEKKLVGLRLCMSYAQYKANELWGRFMPRLKEIANPAGNDLVSLAVYPPGFFTAFDPNRQFERWAAVEVTKFEQVPDAMETFVLPAGVYAVFHYKGMSSNSSAYQYIFNIWLPASDYQLANRPHFEVLGAQYKNNDPESEETIWIPVQPK